MTHKTQTLGFSSVP